MRCIPSLLRLAPLLAAFAWTGAEASALRWEPAAEGAAIVLPVPKQAQGIVGGTLFCRAQEWAFLLRTDRAAPAAARARVAVGEETIEVFAEAGAGMIEVPLPFKAVALLKDGTGLGITVGEGEESLSARFPLAGSRAAIETAAPRCSPPTLAGFEAVGLAPEGPAPAAAAALTAEEAALFRAASSAEPVLAAAFVPMPAGRELLFASLCGSHRYYGETGCKLMGFSREGAGAWQAVYETEGMHLLRDPRAAHDGWPDLLTLSVAGEAERLRWTWRDGAYAPEDEAVAGDAPTVIDELRTGTTRQ